MNEDGSNRGKIIEQINEKKHLIQLTEAMANDTEMGMGPERAKKTIKLLKNDISKLERGIGKSNNRAAFFGMLLILSVIVLFLYAPPQIKNPLLGISQSLSFGADNKYPTINGAGSNERAYIINILNNTKPDLIRRIKSINVVLMEKVAAQCKDKTIFGCATSGGDIYVVPIAYYSNPSLRKDLYMQPGAGYIQCGTFAETLNHEIGHIKGFSVGDESEVYAENYAYDHTMVNIVYEHEKRC